MHFRPAFAQKIRTGVTSFPGTGYLSWFGSLTVSSVGLKVLCRGATVAVRYSNPRGPVGPWAMTISPVRIRRPRRTNLPIWDKGARSPLLVTSHTSSANDPMCHVCGFTASSPCVSVHMPVASVFPRAQHAHVRALLPVRGVKPREYGSNTPVTTQPGITAKIYSIH